MRFGVLDDRVLVLFQRDIDPLLPVCQPLIEELQPERRLTRTERSHDHERVRLRDASLKELVQSVYSGLNSVHFAQPILSVSMTTRPLWAVTVVANLAIRSISKCGSMLMNFSTYR